MTDFPLCRAAGLRLRQPHLMPKSDNVWAFNAEDVEALLSNAPFYKTYDSVCAERDQLKLEVEQAKKERLSKIRQDFIQENSSLKLLAENANETAKKYRALIFRAIASGDLQTRRHWDIWLKEARASLEEK